MFRGLVRRLLTRPIRSIFLIKCFLGRKGVGDVGPIQCHVESLPLPTDVYFPVPTDQPQLLAGTVQPAVLVKVPSSRVPLEKPAAADVPASPPDPPLKSPDSHRTLS